MGWELEGPQTSRLEKVHQDVHSQVACNGQVDQEGVLVIEEVESEEVIDCSHQLFHIVHADLACNSSLFVRPECHPDSSELGVLGCVIECKLSRRLE